MGAGHDPPFLSPPPPSPHPPSRHSALPHPHFSYSSPSSPPPLLLSLLLPLLSALSPRLRPSLGAGGRLPRVVGPVRGGRTGIEMKVSSRVERVVREARSEQRRATSRADRGARWALLARLGRRPPMGQSRQAYERDRRWPSEFKKALECDDTCPYLALPVRMQDRLHVLSSPPLSVSHRPCPSPHCHPPPCLAPFPSLPALLPSPPLLTLPLIPPLGVCL